MVNTTESANVFYNAPQPPPTATGSDLSPAETAPAFISPTAGYEAGESAFQVGQDAYGFERVTPQQWQIQRVCDSTNPDGTWLYPFLTVNLPRRSGKSVSTYGLAFGRCLTRPGYRVAVTMATTGTKLSQRFKMEVFDRLEAYGDRTGRTIVPIKSNGHEAVRFDNGSVLVLLPPKESAFRSEAFDLVLIDEAGEANSDMSDALIQAALPTLDTTGGQLIAAGTPPESRAGNLLHEWQAIAMSGDDPDYGAVLYGIAEDLTVEDVATWELTAPLVERSHPGISSGLVVGGMNTMRRTYMAMGPQRFAREYLGQSGRDEATAGVINPAHWAACEVDAVVSLPDYFAVGFSVNYDDAFGAVVAAWRDADGRANLALLEYKPGSAWLPALITEKVDKYPKMPFAVDDKGTAWVEAGKVQRDRPRAKIERRNWTQVQQAAALLVREIHTRNLVHYGQEDLTDAALIASRRGDQKAFAFGRPEQSSQIAAIEAAALALHVYDEKPQRQAFTTIVMSN